jgi:hypothetical protein
VPVILAFITSTNPIGGPEGGDMTRSVRA